MNYKKWHNELLGNLDILLPPEKLQEMLYVADSTRVTSDNLHRLADKKLSFISRLPNAVAVEAEVKEPVWQKKIW